MTAGPCHRCVDVGPTLAGLGGAWCRAIRGPATGNGCCLFRERAGDPCPARCAMPDGNGTICLETFDVLSAGPCSASCEHRGTAGRWRR